jgi:hypothetical protein
MKRLALLMLLSCALVMVSRISKAVPGPSHVVADQDDGGDSDDSDDDS